MGFKLEFIPDPEAYARTAEAQRGHAREIARRLEAGESLHDLPSGSGEFAAAILRLWANTLPNKPPRKRGQAPQIDASNIALEFVAMTRNPKAVMSKVKVKEHLAEKYGVSVEAIRGALKKKLKDAEAFFDFGEQHGTVYYAKQKEE